MTLVKSALWATWREEAKRDAERRWAEVNSPSRLKMTGKEWFKATRKKLIRLAELEILALEEQQRVKQLVDKDVEPTDQRRLAEAGHKRSLYAYGIARQPHASSPEDAPREKDVPLWRSALRLNDGKRLREGRLGMQIFINEQQGMPVSMSIQLRGRDPARSRPMYLRYDLDPVPLGSGPVTHFSSHWHAGDDPDAKDAEDHDPRLPALILDPLAVIDILVETFWPKGPEDVADP